MIFSYLLLSSAAAMGTFWLGSQRQQDVIRASAGLTLVFSFLLFGAASFFDFVPSPFLQVFFGASFVGMSLKEKIGWKVVLLASWLFAALYIIFFPKLPVQGGSLGLCAFISVLSASGLRMVAERFHSLSKNTNLL